MTRLEFTLATITQELGVLATARRTGRETWFHVAMPSIARIATLSNTLAEDRPREQQTALRSLSGAVSALVPPTEMGAAGTEPHSTNEAWAAVTAATQDVRRTFAGLVEAWVLPT